MQASLLHVKQESTLHASPGADHAAAMQVGDSFQKLSQCGLLAGCTGVALHARQVMGQAVLPCFAYDACRAIPAVQRYLTCLKNVQHACTKPSCQMSHSLHGAWYLAQHDAPECIAWLHTCSMLGCSRCPVPPHPPRDCPARMHIVFFSFSIMIQQRMTPFMM